MVGATSSFSESGKTVSFARRLAESPRFKTMFRDGMALVEQVAAYLDGPGRDEAKTLPRPLALAYAAESMRLTTRLMQLASWLLVQRAVNEGEMTQAQADAQTHKVDLSSQDIVSSAAVFAELPDELRELTARSIRLQARLLYLDRCIRLPDHAPEDATGVVDARARPHALYAQWDSLRSAFGRHSPHA